MSVPDPIPCPVCGAKVLSPARYCDLCGTALGPAATKPPPKPPA